jgi:hypothetical protein
MDYPKYQLTASVSLMDFRFLSEGRNGTVSKMVQFKELPDGEVYNLAFGDEITTDTIDDLTITNNGDTPIILATVALAVYEFTAAYPDKYVYFSGSTVSRTRLYRMGIARNLKELLETFIIYGRIDDHWEIFELNKEYLSYLVKRK